MGALTRRMGCGASSQPAEPTFGVDDAVSACEEVQSFYIDEDDGKLKSHMTNMLELDKPERFVEEVVMKAVLTMVGSKIGVEPRLTCPGTPRRRPSPHGRPAAQTGRPRSSHLQRARS